MTRQKRRDLKRTAAQAHYDLDRSLSRLHTLYEQFEPVHPEYAQFLIAIAQNITISQEMILKFWGHAWGKIPEDLNAYRE